LLSRGASSVVILLQLVNTCAALLTYLLTYLLISRVVVTRCRGADKELWGHVVWLLSWRHDCCSRNQQRWMSRYQFHFSSVRQRLTWCWVLSTSGPRHSN